MPYPTIYCFGVRPNAYFQSHDGNGAFHVVDQGPHLIRATIEVLMNTPAADHRLTPDDLKEAIQSTYYFTADTATHDPELCTMTFCILKLKNGFFVDGRSAPVDPNNFDPEIGKQVAYQRAFDKLWPLLGYAARSRLAALGSTGT